MTLETLRSLQKRVRKAAGPSHELDIALTQFFYPEMDATILSLHGARLDTSIDACVRLVGEILPGWTWKCGTCCVSDDAWIAPDWNSPTHGKRLREKYGEPVFNSIWDTGVDIDRRPPGNVCLALIEGIFEVLIAEEHEKQTEKAGCASTDGAER